MCRCCKSAQKEACSMQLLQLCEGKMSMQENAT